MLRVVLADDEPLARSRLRALLADHADVVIAAEAEDAEAALHAIRTTKPDVAFLDVQMPGFTGLELAGRLHVTPAPFIVFVTAHARHAVEATLADRRPASRGDALAGMDDRDAVVAVGASASVRTGPVEAAMSVARELNDSAGVLGAARLSLTQRLGRVMATAGVGVTLADARQMRRDFGVSLVEAGRRQQLIDAGDPRLGSGDGDPYRPGGGLRHVSGSLSLFYPLSRRSMLFGFGSAARLSDDAAASPLVRRRTGFTGGIGWGLDF